MKVVICGAGAMGMTHLETLASLDSVEIVGVADPDAGKLGGLAERGVNTFPDGAEMLDSAEADLAVVATPTAEHAPLTLRALEAGMHVFCEKPLARTLEDGEKIAEAARKAGRTVGVGYVLRYHDAYRVAARYIREGTLGTIGTVRTSRCAPLSRPWHADLEAHGGVSFELLTHDLDWLRWALGPAERVFARGLAQEGRAAERDYALAVMRFQSGAIAHLEGSLAEEDNFYASYEIAGSDGLLSYDTRESSVLESRLITSEGLEVASDTPQNERPFLRQMKAFVEAVRSGEEYELCAQAALPALRLTCAVYESIRSGRPVEF